jgi:uncharacterized protein YprB with RNaseH-like and TPR domain
MKGNLKARLARAREISSIAAKVPTRGKPKAPMGWIEIGANVYSRTVDTGLLLPDSALQRGFSLSGWMGLASGEEPEKRVSYSETCFFDLETTGLSGGAGTVAFLSGLGYFEGRNFIVEQIFIDDFPGEPIFLERLLESLKKFSTIVSFNGACFDLPLLKSRCILNNLNLDQYRHIDALKMARRFWKGSFASCSLQCLETELLERRRIDDIPGFLIPRLWLDYSRAGLGCSSDLVESMAKVFKHNCLDIQSLAELFMRMDRIMEEPQNVANRDRVNIPRFAKTLLDQSRIAEGLDLLRCAGIEGDQTSLRMLAWFSRRMRDHEGYVWAVTSLGDFDWRSNIEKAKFYEHERKDFLTALAHAVKAAELAVRFVRDYPQLDEALTRRIRRLERKIEDRNQGESARSVSPN